MHVNTVIHSFLRNWAVPALLSVAAVGTFLAPACFLQAQATGNTPAVSQPSWPTVCSIKYAALTITNGDLTTGLSPDQETLPDTARIQSALNSCASGQAVELASSGTNQTGFLTGPLYIPSGVKLQIDAGVTLFASRFPSDYQRSGATYNCGTEAPVSVNPDGCLPLITTVASAGSGSGAGPAGPSTGAGVIGYGVIDGRGPDQLLQWTSMAHTAYVNYPFASAGTTQTTSGWCMVNSWWCLTTDAYDAYPSSTGLYTENNPMMIQTSSASNFTLFMVTIARSPYFNVRWAGPSSGTAIKNLTVWGVKIKTAHDIPNTDGIDPVDNMSNVTIEDTYISNGDDNVAIDADYAHYGVSAISLLNVQTYAGDGISIGTGILGGVSNVLVNGLYQNGETGSGSGSQTATGPARGQAGIKLKSNSKNGGAVNNVTYENVCMQNETTDIYIDPYVGTYPDSNWPAFGTPPGLPINFANITVTPVSGYSGYLRLKGSPTNTTYITLTNVDAGAYPKITSSEKSQYLNVAIQALGSIPVGDVYPADGTFNLQALNTGQPPTNQYVGLGVTESGTAGTNETSAFHCTSYSYPQFDGQLFISDGTHVDPNNNLQRYSITSGTGVYLNAVLVPTTYESPAPTAGITFYDETGHAYGPVTASNNGTLFEYGFAPTATHTYYANYPGDSNYHSYQFGSVTITVH